MKFARLNQYIATANDDLSIPPNSRIVAELAYSQPDNDLEDLLKQANAHDGLVTALTSIACYDPTRWDAATLGNIARSALAAIEAHELEVIK